MKTLVIGDIHGCYNELLTLFDKAALSTGDQIIALGDLLDRGPDSAAVLRFFQSRSNSASVMGNHERKHLLSFEGQIGPSVSQIMTQQGFASQSYLESLNFIRTFPNYIELPEAILVHGMLEPGIALPEQSPNVLNGNKSGERYLLRKYYSPWYVLYDGTKPVIAGHRDYSQTGSAAIYRDLVFLIDTGCCYGRCLTGLLLPDFQIVSVKSKRNYWGIARQSHRKGS